MIEHILGTVGVPFGIFVVCFLSAVLPLIHAEAFLIAVSAVSAAQDPKRIALYTVLAAAGQMLGKCIIYFSGKGLVSVSKRGASTTRFAAWRLRVGSKWKSRPGLQERMASWRERIARWSKRPGLLCFLSAASGFPPFMVVAAVAGPLGFPFRSFLVFGFLGRIVRFGFALGIPQMIKHYF